VNEVKDVRLEEFIGNESPFLFDVLMASAEYLILILCPE
jgi:hypothetical protein